MLCVLGDTPVMLWVCAPVRPGSGKGELDKRGDRGCVLVCVCVNVCMARWEIVISVSSNFRVCLTSKHLTV